jgi:TetR/AcrR family transcriptional regulator
MLMPRGALIQSVADSGYHSGSVDIIAQIPFRTRFGACPYRRSRMSIADRMGGSRERTVRWWIGAGRLKPIEPRFLFYMIWATTQQYANAAHEIATLNGGSPLDDKAFERAKAQAVEIILRGVTAE